MHVARKMYNKVHGASEAEAKFALEGNIVTSKGSLPHLELHP